MTAKELGQQPARPQQFYAEGERFKHGLTKREQFAMAAMQGLLSNSSRSGNITIGTPNGEKSLTYEVAAVMLADALLGELAKGMP